MDLWVAYQIKERPGKEVPSEKGRKFPLVSVPDFHSGGKKEASKSQIIEEQSMPPMRRYRKADSSFPSQSKYGSSHRMSLFASGIVRAKKKLAKKMVQ